MELKNIILAGCICLMASCNDQPTKTVSTTPVTKVGSINCYQYINKKDTVTLKTIVADELITGSLVYNFYEKDKNSGTIRGSMKGDLLIADYSFMSEGVNSVRQVAFKKSEGAFIEGYGEPQESNGRTTFKNIDSLNFNNSVLLSKVDCEK